MARRRCRAWTEEEVLWLRQHWVMVSEREAAVALGRNMGAVRAMASKLGLRKTGSWNAVYQARAEVMRRQGLSLQEIGRRLGGSKWMVWSHLGEPDGR